MAATLRASTRAELTTLCAFAPDRRPGSAGNREATAYAAGLLEARGWEAVTGQTGFQPLKGFSVVGLEWSVVVNGNCGVVVRNRDIDYEASFKAVQAG